MKRLITHSTDFRSNNNLNIAKRATEQGPSRKNKVIPHFLPFLSCSLPPTCPPSLFPQRSILFLSLFPQPSTSILVPPHSRYHFISPFIPSRSLPLHPPSPRPPSSMEGTSLARTAQSGPGSTLRYPNTQSCGTGGTSNMQRHFGQCLGIFSQLFRWESPPIHSSTLNRDERP